MIIIDGSEDFKMRFTEILDFLQGFIDRLFIGENRTRVGVMVFGDTAIQAVMLNITDRKTLADAISNVKFIDHQGTNPTAALQELLNAFTPDGDYGARKGSPNVAQFHMAVMFTDGQNSNNPTTQAAAMAVGMAGIFMHVVAVGDDMQLTPDNRAGLNAIAASTGGNKVLSVDPTDPEDVIKLENNLFSAIVGPDCKLI